MGSRTAGMGGMTECWIYSGNRVKNPNRTKAEKLAQTNARAAKNKSLRARCGGLEARNNERSPH